jgi:hypothetical protein
MFTTTIHPSRSPNATSRRSGDHEMPPIGSTLGTHLDPCRRATPHKAGRGSATRSRSLRAGCHHATRQGHSQYRNPRSSSTTTGRRRSPGKRGSPVRPDPHETPPPRTRSSQAAQETQQAKPPARTLPRRAERGKLARSASSRQQTRPLRALLAGAQTGARDIKSLQIGMFMAVSKAVIRLRRIEGSNPSPSAQPRGSRLGACLPGAKAVSRTSPVNPGKSIDVSGRALVYVVTGARLAHGPQLHSRCSRSPCWQSTRASERPPSLVPSSSKKRSRRPRPRVRPIAVGGLVRSNRVGKWLTASLQEALLGIPGARAA